MNITKVALAALFCCKTNATYLVLPQSHLLLTVAKHGGHGPGWHNLKEKQQTNEQTKERSFIVSVEVPEALTAALGVSLFSNKIWGGHWFGKCSRQCNTPNSSKKEGGKKTNYLHVAWMRTIISSWLLAQLSTSVGSLVATEQGILHLSCNTQTGEDLSHELLVDFACDPVTAFPQWDTPQFWNIRGTFGRKCEGKVWHIWGCACSGQNQSDS